MKSVIFLSLAVISRVWGQSCDDFKAGTCPLEEDNLVGSNSGVDSPASCQILCKYNGGGACHFFTHFGTECYQLSTCDSIEVCEGCVSGPTDPPYDSCTQTTVVTDPPTDPPTNSPTEPPTDPTTEPPTDPTTEPPTDSPTEPPTDPTTEPPTDPTTGPTDPTEAPLPDCNVNIGAFCNSEGNLIAHIEHIHDVSDCQAICQNHAQCEFWSHYLEEGREHWGHCFLHYQCDQLDTHECHGAERPECPAIPSIVFNKFIRHLPITKKEPRPGPGAKCYCMSGANQPDLDECEGDIPGVFPCIDQFFPETRCGGGPENEVAHMEGISMASDCQAICQNHNDCSFFSHWTEEGPEAWGHCFLHRHCDEFDERECEWNNCFSGPEYPDMDDCSYPEF